MFRATGMIIGVVILLQGCSGSSVKQQKPAAVTSTPSAATVYANGVNLGLTPLHHDLYKAFPASWVDWVYQATGVLMVKMDGCEDYTLKVNDYILSKPIHADLKCSGVSRPEKITPVVSEKNDSVVPPVVKPDSETEKRLTDLEVLYKKGVITTDEYRETRKRILNEL